MGNAPIESKDLELWISRQMISGIQTSQIADEIIRQWESASLSISAQHTASRFCILNGYYTSLIRMLRKFLAAGTALPWAHVIEVVLTDNDHIPKELVDSLFIGATRDKLLLSTSAQALIHNEKDPRWLKIFDSEIKEKNLAAEKKRDALYQEVLIFKREGMHREQQDVVKNILAMFPQDRDANQLAVKHQEQSLDETLANIRRNHDRRDKPRSLKEPEVKWPKLSTRLAKLKKRLNLESAYELAIGLHQMALHQDALLILRTQKNKWMDRERCFEMELLLAEGQFAQALENSQKILKEQIGDAELIFTAIYISAKAYRGLEDFEQATSIIRGLLKHRPDYRDAPLLLREWES
ncbi:MAG: hypothetical protein SGI74_06565 [Oligoflexia bacterium]|nr:hypothetical protein [Oligoflexia bacterium]